TRKLLKRLGLKVSDLDVIESNEAFAAQACAVSQQLEFDPEKVNPNGSGISLGHPVGATGAIIATKALYELRRIGGRYALVTMCIGGGQGIAAVFERVWGLLALKGHTHEYANSCPSRREAQSWRAPDEHSQRRGATICALTLRAVRLWAGMRCCKLLAWINHAASLAPSLPAHSRAVRMSF